jgi:predicted dehydrogenase
MKQTQTGTSPHPLKPNCLSASASPAPLSRRQFITTSAAAWATINIVPHPLLGAPGQPAPNQKPALAGVGVGGVGFHQLQACERAGFSIVALCDVDDEYAKKAFDRWPQTRRYRDCREMLQAEGDKIDAVYCGTPDHTHAVIVLEALKRKKPVCCVKPVTRTLHENRVVVDAARAAGVATQVTAAPNTSDAACRTCELIWAGAIGPVREVHVWSNRPLWPQGMLRPTDQDPVPKTLDWDLWIGPAPMRPFKANWPKGHLTLEQVNLGRGNQPGFAAVYHPWNFRGWWDFGTGALGDMGCHHINAPYRALKLTHPRSVHASASEVFEETAPLASMVTYDYPARADMPPVRVTWYDGGLRPPRPLDLPPDRPWPTEGVLYVGDEGKMLEPDILSPERAAKFANVPKTLPRRSGTWGEWFEAVQGGEPAGCHFGWADYLTEFVLVGNIAIRTGQYLEWDAAKLEFTNQKEANRYVKEEYRAGWTL